MASEIELKLALEPADQQRLMRLPTIADGKIGRGRTTRLVSTYYDTPDFALARAGVTVRVRSAKGKTLQTVKTAGNRAAGLFARGEWESDIPTSSPDRVLLRATALPPLQDDGTLDALSPVFVTEIARTIYRLASDDWEVELALDAGAVRAGQSTMPIGEVELELMKGEPASLFTLARSIVRGVPARLSSLSKSDRGYELATGAAPMPVKAMPVTLGGGDTVVDAFQAIARNCLQQALANERCLLATGTPEAIHQMRVALRRLRSAIKIFRPIVAGQELDNAHAEIRWLLSQLGPARDGQVFVEEIIDPVVQRFPDNPALAALRAHWLNNAEHEHKTAVAAVANRRFIELMLDLGAWVETGRWRDGAPTNLPLSDFAAAVLVKCDKRMRKAGSKDLSRLSAEQLHRVRILGKQMRYAGEFFASLRPGKTTRAFLAATADLQDALGALNDIAVAGPKLAADRHDGEGVWCAGLVTGWHEARCPALLSSANKAWKRFRKADRYWTKA